MTFIPDDPSLWPYFRPTIIAHDVGRTIDRSTAVVGGFCNYAPGILSNQGIQQIAGHVGRSHLLEACTAICKRAESALRMARRRAALMRAESAGKRDRL